MEAIMMSLYNEVLLCHTIQRCVQNLNITTTDLYKTNVAKRTQTFVYSL